MFEIGADPRVNTQLAVPRRRRASIHADTRRPVPSAALTHEIGGEREPVSAQQGANVAAHTSSAVPSAATNAGHLVPEYLEGRAGGGRVQGAREHRTEPDLSATIQALVQLQRQRAFCIKSQSRCDRSVEAFIARVMGYHPEQPEAERAAVWKRAAAFRREAEKRGDAPEVGGGGHPGADNQHTRALAACTPIILRSAEARAGWDKHRTHVEREMRVLARTLPAYGFVQSVAGFGDLGLAIVVGETGDLSGYATKERVWKRLGLAVIGGERQRKVQGEAAMAHGYSPRRRAEAWTLLSDSMFRHQWRAATDDQAAGPKGPYGEVYARRKAHTETRGWTLGHRHNDARRIMSKFLLENLWRAWNGKPPLMPAQHGEPRE